MNNHEMPDIEKVRQACHQRFASQPARNTMGLKRFVPAAAAFILLFAVSTTVFAAVGGFDGFVQRFNPRFAEVVAPVMAYADREGIRITVIGAQSFDSMAVVYLSVTELTEQNRLSAHMDWWPGLHLHIEGMGGVMQQNLLYFDAASRTAYLEVRFAMHEAIPQPLTITVDQLALYPAEAISGNWVITAYTPDTTNQHIAVIAHKFMLCDAIFIERVTLTPLGLAMEGTFGVASDNTVMSLLQAEHEVYVEVPGGLIPLTQTGGGMSIDAYGLDMEELPPISWGPNATRVVDGVPTPIPQPDQLATVAMLMETGAGISISIRWQTEAPINIAEASAIIVNGIRIPVS